MRRTALFPIAAIAALALPLAAVAQQPSQLFPEARQGPPPGAAAPAGPAIIYTAELIAVPQITPDLAEALKPVHSLQQAEEMLKVRGLSFMWRRGELNSATLPAAFAHQLAVLPPHEVFLIPAQNGGVVMGVIVQQHPATAGGAPTPLPATPATKR